MVPTKVEVTLKKADPVAWGKLEDPKHKPEPEVTDITAEPEDTKPDCDISDDDISESDWDETDDEEKKENKENKENEEKEKEDNSLPLLEEAKDVPPEK